MRFQVKAVGKQGVIRTTIEAACNDDAARLAERQGMKILSLRAERSLWSPPAFLRLASNRRKGFPLLLFSQELATLLAAGLALIDALESLREQDDDEHTRTVLNGVIQSLYEGKPFSQSLGKFPEEFPELFVALIQSSEKTGSIGDALNRYAAYRQRIDLVRQKIVSASVYPLLLFSVGSAVLLFLLGYVVPRFSVILEVGAHLPWLSRVLLGLGQQIHAHQSTFVGGLAGLLITAAVLLRMPSVRAAIVNTANEIPAIRHRLHLYQLARLYRSLGILLQGGIPVLAAIFMARGLVDAATRAKLEQAGEDVRQGRSLSHALTEAGLSTPVARRMLRAGEQAGNLGAMMERTADFHDDEIGRWLEWFVRLFEPLLMIFVGGVIGVIVILMYIPIFELAGSLQ